MLLTLTEMNEIASALAVDAAPSSNPNNKTDTKTLGVVTVISGSVVIRIWAQDWGLRYGAAVNSRQLVRLVSFLST